MNANKGFKSIAVIAIIVSVICISIAFAALQATLKIEGTATVKTADAWSISFTNIKNNAATLGAEEVTVPTATTTPDLSWSALFKAPGAKYTFTATIKNNGTIPAKLESGAGYLTTTGTASTKFTYSVKIDNQSINDYQGYVWAAGASKDIVVTVIFDEEGLLTQDDLKSLNTETVTFNLNLPFTQATDADVASATTNNKIFTA